MSKKTKVIPTQANRSVTNSTQVTRTKGKKQALRNFHACHPILKKGGVHEKSKGAKRLAAKRHVRQKVNEWLSRSLWSKPDGTTHLFPSYKLLLKALYI